MLRKAQERDHTLDRERAMAASKETGASRKGAVHDAFRNSTLQWTFKTPHAEHKQLCVPTGLREGVLGLSHDTPTGKTWGKTNAAADMEGIHKASEAPTTR